VVARYYNPGIPSNLCIEIFENGGARGHHLELEFKYLMSTPPNSIEAERAYSAAALCKK